MHCVNVRKHYLVLWMSLAVVLGLMIPLSSAVAAAPNTYPGLVLWLDAGDPDGNGVTADNPADGADLVSWMDKSGNNNHAMVSAGQNAGAYVSDPLEMINGRPVIRFSRVNSLTGSVYNVASLDIRAVNMEDITIFTVYRARSVPAGHHGLWGNDNGSWDRFFLPFHQGFGDGVDDGLASKGPAEQGEVVGDAGQVGAVRLLTAVYDGSVNGGVNNGPVDGSTVYFDGVQITSFTDSTDAGAAQSSFFIGLDGDDGAYDGDIAEMVIYDRVLSPEEFTEVTRHLAQKYNQNFNVPPAQPVPTLSNLAQLLFMLFLMAAGWVALRRQSGRA